jgi:hypothetical protein
MSIAIRLSHAPLASVLGTCSLRRLGFQAKCSFAVSHNVISSFRLPENLVLTKARWDSRSPMLSEWLGPGPQ